MICSKLKSVQSPLHSTINQPASISNRFDEIWKAEKTDSEKPEIFSWNGTFAEICGVVFDSSILAFVEIAGRTEKQRTFWSHTPWAANEKVIKQSELGDHRKRFIEKYGMTHDPIKFEYVCIEDRTEAQKEAWLRAMNPA